MAAFACVRSTTNRSRRTMPTKGGPPFVKVPTLKGSGLRLAVPAWARASVGHVRTRASRSTKTRAIVPPVMNVTASDCLRRLPLRDVAIDHARENRHRHIAAEHDGVVQRLDVVAGAEVRLGLASQPIDFAVPDLVAARLTRPRAVSIDFASHLFERGSVGLGEPADRLLARPAPGMQTRVYDEAAGAKCNRLKVAEPA